jgi:hypothetical protein
MHSWIGISTIFFFVLQFASGFIVFLLPGAARTETRHSFIPLHAYWGLFTYICSIISIGTGVATITEFLQTVRHIDPYNDEMYVAKFIAVAGIVLLGCVLYITMPKRNPTPLRYLSRQEHQALLQQLEQQKQPSAPAALSARTPPSSTAISQATTPRESFEYGLRTPIRKGEVYVWLLLLHHPSTSFHSLL